MFDISSLKNKAEKFAKKIEGQIATLFKYHQETQEDLDEIKALHQQNIEKINLLMEYVHCTNKAIHSDQDPINQIKLCGTLIDNDCEI